MRRLTDKIPDCVKVGKAVYHFKAPFDTVLFILDVLDDDSILPEHREALCCRLLFGHRLWGRRKRQQALNAFLRIVAPHADKTQHKPVMSFSEDAALIRAAFLQQYGIDLDAERGKMSWFQFTELVSGLTDQTQFGQVVSLRSKPIPEPTKYNIAERAALIQAKQRVAIKGKASEAGFYAGFAALADRLIKEAGETK